MTNNVYVPSQEGNPFFCPRQDSAEFERLPDGVHVAVCCGCGIRQFTGYEDKLFFLYQVVAEGATYYFRSKFCRPLIGERSSLFILINTWTGATLDRVANGFDACKMIGYPAQLVVVSKINPKDGKNYQELANILKAPKGTKIPVTPDAIPEYLVRGCSRYMLAEGLTVKPPRAAEAPASAPAPAPTPAPAVEEPVPEASGSDLPF